MLLRRKRRPVKLIVAVPPKHFFGGNDRSNADLLVESLRDVYPNIFIFNVGVLNSKDRVRYDRLIEAAKDFRADVGLALPNASYALMLKPLPPENPEDPKYKRAQRYRRWRRQNWPMNVFTDVLGVRTILLWDHIITQLPYLTVGDLPASRHEGGFGTLDRMRLAIADPGYLHYVPDSGHIAVMQSLGVSPPRPYGRYVVPAHGAFLQQDTASADPKATAVLFAGNLGGQQETDFRAADQRMLAEIDREVLSGKMANWCASSWQLFADATRKWASTCPELVPDHTFYWSLANRLVGSRLTTEFRNKVLASTRLPVDYFGGFANPERAKTYDLSGHIVHRGAVAMAEMPALYRSYRVSVDVTNGPFIFGSNAKVLDCFAAGGFMLVDWRKDLAEELGDLANAFMYRDRSELEALFDKVLSNEHYRAEVIAEMRSRIAQRLTFDHLLQNLIESALAG